MNDKTLFKWVSQYCDKTIPNEIVCEAVEEIKILHEEGKIRYNEEAVYDFVHQIKRGKEGEIIECEGRILDRDDEVTEPEEWEAMDCLEGGLFNQEREEVLE